MCLRLKKEPISIAISLAFDLEKTYNSFTDRYIDISCIDIYVDFKKKRIQDIDRGKRINNDSARKIV